MLLAQSGPASQLAPPAHVLENLGPGKWPGRTGLSTTLTVYHSVTGNHELTLVICQQINSKSCQQPASANNQSNQ